MGRVTACVLLLTAAALAWPAAPRAQRRQPRAQIRLLETGHLHLTNVGARTGETWLGLYVSRGGSSLVPSVVTVEPFEDPVADEPGQMTGRAVSVRRADTPVFLVNKSSGLKPGRVVTSHAGGALLTPASDVTIRLAGSDYRLSVETKDKSSAEGVTLDDARLVLSRGPVRQVVYSLGGEGRGTETVEWKVLWAGDLDGDRALDLYVQVSWHYNVAQHLLLLSSPAGAGRLVRRAAEFKIYGC